MKKFLIILALLFITFNQSIAQEYKQLLDSAKIYFEKEKYFEAYENYNAARVYGKKFPSIVLKAEAGMKKSIVKIKKQKEIVDSLLVVAKEMQLKVETAMFDKAVKEYFKDWKGYANYKHESERKEILQQINSLDLSNNALMRVPKEIAECPNLTHINLLGNNDIDWASSENTLSRLNKNAGIYVSVNDLSDIDSTYWKLITGIEIRGNSFLEIPQNILEQKQLTYLDLSFNQLSSLPVKIGNLTNLITLYFRKE